MIPNMESGDAINVTSLLPSVISTNVLREISETATKVALQHFEWRFMTMVYFNSNLYFGVEMFLKSYRKAVAIGRGTFYPKFGGKTRQFVVFGTNLINIAHALKWMRDHEFDNTGKFIIVCQDRDECNESLAMKMLWRYKITNVIFLKSDLGEVAGFTYFPLNNTSCVYDEPVRLKNLASCLNFKEACNLFPVKLFNLNGCPLIVTTFVHQPFMKLENGIPSGTDGDLLLLIAEKLNGNLKVMTPKIGDGWGKLEEDGSWSGSLADLFYDYANFSIISAALTLSRSSNFQLSTGYNTEIVIWVTPPAKTIPSSLKLSYPFARHARTALAISFAIVVLCSLIFHIRLHTRVKAKLKLYRPRYNIIFYSWMICMGLSIPTRRLPKKTALLYIVLLWMWYCLLVRTFYQVSLISVMKTNYHFKELKSLEEVIEEEIPFGGFAGLKDYYIDTPVVYNNWNEIDPPEIIPTLRKIAQGTEFVLAMSLLTAKTIIWEEKMKVNLLPEKLVSSPAVLFFKKFSPLADAVNKVLNRLHEAGISAKFFKDYAPTVVYKETDTSVEAIELEHFTGCYVVLILGWLVSFLLFLGEIIFDKIWTIKEIAL